MKKNIKKNFLPLVIATFAFSTVDFSALNCEKKESTFSDFFSDSLDKAQEMMKKAEEQFSKGMKILEKNFKEMESKMSKKMESAKEVVKKIEKEITPSPTEVSVSWDYSDKKDKYEVEATLPGFEEKDVTVTVKEENGSKLLTISASKMVTIEKQEEGKVSKSSEKKSFLSSRTLPKDVDTKNFSKKWENGKLKVEFGLVK